MALSIVAFSVGPGCIGWFVIVEMFPPYARDAAMGLGIGINWISNWLIAISFPTLLDAFGPHTFGLFALSTAGFGAFTYRFVPETKGRSLLQVVDDLDSRFDGRDTPLRYSFS